MPQYIPPPQFNIETRINVFRPDDRDRIHTEASYLADDYSIGLQRFDYANPNESLTRLQFTLELSPNTTAEIGAAYVDGDVVPEFGIETVLLDESDRTIKLSYNRGAMDNDPRAVEALLQHNTVGLSMNLDDVSVRLETAFNSDGVEVYEGFLSIPLTESGWATLRNYTRIASTESEFYWSPELFSNTGVLIGVPVEFNSRMACQFGVQPGLRLTGNEVKLSGGAGGRCGYEGDRFSINGEIGYAFGMTAGVRAEWRH